MSSKSCLSAEFTCPASQPQIRLSILYVEQRSTVKAKKYMSRESPTQSVYSVVAHLEQPRVEECGFWASRQNRWLTPCPWGGQPAFLARGACRALDSRAFQMHRSRLVASLTWTHNFSCQNLRVFGGKIICLRKRSEVSDGVSFVLA